MRKVLLTTILNIFILTAVSFAQEKKEDIMRDILISKEQENKMLGKQAQAEARKSLHKRKKLHIDTKDLQIKKNNKPKVKTSKNYGEAPFGIIWGYDAEDTKSLGVILKDISTLDSPKTYSANLLPKGIEDFDEYVLYFGNHKSGNHGTG